MKIPKAPRGDKTEAEMLELLNQIGYVMPRQRPSVPTKLEDLDERPFPQTRFSEKKSPHGTGFLIAILLGMVIWGIALFLA